MQQDAINIRFLMSFHKIIIISNVISASMLRARIGMSKNLLVEQIKSNNILKNKTRIIYFLKMIKKYNHWNDCNNVTSSGIVNSPVSLLNKKTNSDTLETDLIFLPPQTVLINGPKIGDEITDAPYDCSSNSESNVAAANLKYFMYERPSRATDIRTHALSIREAPNRIAVCCGVS